MASRIVLADYKSTYRQIAGSIGSQQCARLIQALEKSEIGVVHLVRQYTGTLKVRNAQDLVEGTVIATLLDGRYPNESRGNHVAVFVKQSDDGKGIVVFDQYTNKPPGERTIRYKGGQHARREQKHVDPVTKQTTVTHPLNMSDDGDFYYVVEV